MRLNPDCRTGIYPWLWLIFIAACLVAGPSRAESLTPALQLQIEQLFPKATRIGEKADDLPVYPVFQLGELLGYAYESRDIKDLPGFSGKPINLMIGLDVSGRFQGVTVMDHHEPVFLHGLGEQPLFDFVDQYKGRSLGEPIVIDSSRAGGGETGGVVYFDGVSKATVSVIIVNDVVLSSALTVARQKLEGFAQAPSVRPLMDLYEPLEWQQLLQRDYVGHWQISREQAEQTLDISLDNYPDLSLPEEADNPATPFIELWYAYINAPSIGRNLLGEAGYQNLMESLKPGQQVLLVMSRGLFGHVEEQFQPGAVPGRLALHQGNLAVEMRDLNALGGPQDPIVFPDADQAHLFAVGGNAGFNPAAEARLVLNLALPRNHLVVDRLQLEIPVTFPQELFEQVEVSAAPERQPLWVGIWKDRWVSIVILSTSLILLTILFARQRYFTRFPRALHWFRAGFLLYTLIWLGWYAQGQLSVVNIYTLFLNIVDGFNINIFLLDPVIFILWSYTFITLFIWGRGLFCGWLCPFGALQEMVSWLGKRLKLRQYRVPERWHRKLILIKYPILLGLVITAFQSLTLAEQLAEIEPFKTSITLYFWRYWPFVLYAIGLLVIGLFIHKFYCRYLCPLGAGLAVLGKLRLFSSLDRVDLCGSPCQLCNRRCEIKAIKSTGEIDYDECIQCLECVVILRDDTQCVDTLSRNKQARKRQTELLATDASQPSA